MPISSPNSKKCSIAKPSPWSENVIALGVAAAWLGTLFLALPHLANAAQAPAGSPRVTTAVLLKELSRRPGNSFEPLLQGWQSRYGSAAVPALIQLASGNAPGARHLEDSDRYIALMGAAKLGGSEAAPLLTRFLKDKSWMIRSGALRALTALRNPSVAQDVLPLLQDPALVVRLEAVEAVEKLQPKGASEALLGTLEHSANYHGGRAQWVPQKALNALATLHASELAPRLRPLLDHEGDPELQKQTIATLETLTGKRMKQDGPLRERIREWKTALNTAHPTR